MAKKLKSILLIDDDEPTNFFHKIMVNEADCTETLTVVTNGNKALDYLNDAYAGKHPVPELIFLDINMPLMDGWEFLAAYEKLPMERRTKIIVIMLTTSINPDDRDKAKQFPEILDFKNKPLSVEMLQEIVEANF